MWDHFNYENFFSCMLLNLYLPCDNFSNVQTTDEYINCIEYVESMFFNSSNCDAFVCCGDLNTSFERDNLNLDIYLTLFQEMIYYCHGIMYYLKRISPM